MLSKNMSRENFMLVDRIAKEFFLGFHGLAPGLLVTLCTGYYATFRVENECFSRDLYICIITYTLV